MEILKIHNNPERAEWAALTERFTREEEEITRQVTEILADVKSGGDRSLREVTRRVEGRDPRTFEIPADVRAAAAALIPAALKEALATAPSCRPRSTSRRCRASGACSAPCRSAAWAFTFRAARRRSSPRC